GTASSSRQAQTTPSSRKRSTEFARGASQLQLRFLVCPASLKEAIPRPGLVDHSSLAIKTSGSPFGGTRIGQPHSFLGDRQIELRNLTFGLGFPQLLRQLPYLHLQLIALALGRCPPLEQLALGQRDRGTRLGREDGHSRLDTDVDAVPLKLAEERVEVVEQAENSVVDGEINRGP